MNDLVVLSMNIANILTANPNFILPEKTTNNRPALEFVAQEFQQQFQRQQRIEAFKPDLINPNINYESLFYNSGSDFSFNAGSDGGFAQNQNSRVSVTRFETITEVYANTENIDTYQRGRIVNFDI